MAIPRSLRGAVVADLPAQMVLVGGPRQVGKTTMARQGLEQIPASI